MVEFNGAERRANQARLRELARLAAGEVALICSHDLSDFFGMKSAAARSPGCASTQRRAPIHERAAAGPAARPPRKAIRPAAPDGRLRLKSSPVKNTFMPVSASSPDWTGR